MRFKRRARDTDAELNITAFLNLMVVLIPFLLLNAVFAQVSILQLNLPSSEDAPPSDPDENKKPLVLEVLIYKDRYEVADRQTGAVLSIVENPPGGGHDREGLRAYLGRVKEQFPDINDVTILCEDDTDYELLIYTMDAVRYRIEMINGMPIKKELFPEIGIGSAPPDSRSGGGA
jgi:biopolymer transport protein ExbD